VQASAPLSFEDAMAAAARKATEAVTKALRDYRHGYLRDEDDITPYLLGFLRIALNGSIGGLTWTASVASHRGRSAEERRTGADILIHVRLDTPTEKYGKGVLVQAKRLEQDSFLPNRELERLQEQCRKMLEFTPAAFVFDYMPTSMRVGSASRIIGTRNRHLRTVCSWTSYRFFLELFRCPIGDPRIESGLFTDLADPPNRLFLTAVGDIAIEPLV
jgi:hypothetical protein